MTEKKTLYPDIPILLVDDDPSLLKGVKWTLELNGFTNVEVLSDGTRVISFLEKRDVALILLDITMPGVRGDILLEEITARFPHIPVIMATATDTVETVVHCMKRSAFDYIVKPFDTSRLLSAVSRALEVAELRREQRARRSWETEVRHNPDGPFGKIITADRQMLHIFNYIEKIADSSQPVLITGETGVGKELIAESIHLASSRQGRLIAVNVAALDDVMFADTLFGHVKGAYTDARTAREGQIRKAEGGMLFLDEIGSLSPASQVKLLRLIQEREYFPLGADMPKKTNVRIIAATNSNLERKVEEESFRRDLFFRLNTHTIHMPPLRERFGDLPLLVQHFVEEAVRESGLTPPKVPEQLFTLLRNYTFPGNVRELQSMVHDAVHRQKRGQMSLESFYEIIVPHGANSDSQNGIAPQVSFGEMLPSSRQLRVLLVEEALRRSGGCVSLAANLIGISRQSLSQFINRNNIAVPNNGTMSSG